MPTKVIIADDSKTIQRAVAIALEGEDLELISVYSPDELLPTIKQVRPVLVLLDNRMNKVGEDDGYQLCREIKADPAVGATPVVFLGGKSYSEEEGEAAGAIGSLEKPFETEKFRQQFLELLEKAKSIASEISTAEAVQEPQIVPPPLPTAFPPGGEEVSQPASPDREKLGDLMERLQGANLRETTAMPTFSPVDLAEMLPQNELKKEEKEREEKDQIPAVSPTLPEQPPPPEPPAIDSYSSSTELPVSEEEELQFAPPSELKSEEDDLQFAPPSQITPPPAPTPETTSTPPEKEAVQPELPEHSAQVTDIPTYPIDDEEPSAVEGETDGGAEDLPDVPPLPGHLQKQLDREVVSAKGALSDTNEITPPAVEPPAPEEKPAAGELERSTSFEVEATVPDMKVPDAIYTEEKRETQISKEEAPSQDDAKPVVIPSPSEDVPDRVIQDLITTPSKTEEPTTPSKVDGADEGERTPLPDFAIDPNKDYLARALARGRKPTLRKPALEPSTSEELAQYEFIKKLSAEIIEKVAWEVVPELAELIIREMAEEIKKKIG